MIIFFSTPPSHVCRFFPDPVPVARWSLEGVVKWLQAVHVFCQIGLICSSGRGAVLMGAVCSLLINKRDLRTWWGVVVQIQVDPNHKIKAHINHTLILSSFISFQSWLKNEKPGPWQKRADLQTVSSMLPHQRSLSGMALRVGRPLSKSSRREQSALAANWQHLPSPRKWTRKTT